MRLLERIFGALPQFTGRSGLWKHVRDEHIRREPACAACGRTKNLEVHHIRPYSKYPELELDDGIDGTGRDGNLITLCADPCHLVFGHLLHFGSRHNLSVREDADRYLSRIREATKPASEEPAA